MATKMNENGVSTCKAGEKYDYRDTADNELFSCVKPTLEECRQKRDEWLIQKQRKYMTEQ